MNPKLIKIAHQLLFLAMVTIAVTGLLKVLNLQSDLNNNIHQTAGMTLIVLFCLHMYIHRQMLKHLFIE